MPKDTPFFKFDSASWLGGSIQFTSLQCKGLFIDLCALYWESNEPVKIDNKLRLRIRVLEGDLSDLIRDLSDLNIIVISDCGVTIPFLDDLREERVEFLKKCSKGGKNSSKNKGSSSNKREERREKKEECRENNIENTNKEKEPLSWIEQANPQYLDFCERYYLMLDENGKVTKSVNWQTKKWYDSIRLMIESDGVTMDQLNKTLNFLKSHLLDDYCPQVWAAPTLRTKWIQLKTYMEKKGCDLKPVPQFDTTTREGRKAKADWLHAQLKASGRI
jgi:hypothetical protein